MARAIVAGCAFKRSIFQPATRNTQLATVTYHFLYQILILTLQFSNQVPPRSSLPIFIILSERYREILAELRF
jgi:hypothetical protein